MSGERTSMAPRTTTTTTTTTMVVAVLLLLSLALVVAAARVPYSGGSSSSPRSPLFGVQQPLQDLPYPSLQELPQAYTHLQFPAASQDHGAAGMHLPADPYQFSPPLVYYPQWAPRPEFGPGPPPGDFSPEYGAPEGDEGTPGGPGVPYWQYEDLPAEGTPPCMPPMMAPANPCDPNLQVPQDLSYDYHNNYFYYPPDWTFGNWPDSGGNGRPEGGPCPDVPCEVWGAVPPSGGGDAQTVVTVCDLDVCKKSCRTRMQYEDGACFNNECYCRQKPKLTLDWNYDRQEDWSKKWPDCGGDPEHSSPQDVLGRFSGADLGKNVRLVRYNRKVSFVAENTGRGVRLYVQSSDPPGLRLEGLPISGDLSDTKTGNFTLARIDLHWSTSEHRAGPPGSPSAQGMEAQLHHYDSDKFESFEEAQRVPGSVVSLALIFDEDSTSTDLDAAISDATSRLVAPDNAGTAVIGSTWLETLAQRTLGTEFAVYSGSETSPPCNRGVTWVVPRPRFKVTKDQIGRFRQIEDETGRKLLNNVRILQGTSGSF